jgi:chromosome segregation ATPase
MEMKKIITVAITALTLSGFNVEAMKENLKKMQDEIGGLKTQVAELTHALKESSNWSGVVSRIEDNHLASVRQTTLVANEGLRSALESADRRRIIELKQQEKTFNLEKEKLQKINEKLEKKNEKLQKELDDSKENIKNLRDTLSTTIKIARIVSYDHIDFEDIIGVSSHDIANMSIHDARDTVSKIYKEKFAPFSEFLSTKKMSKIEEYLRYSDIADLAQYGPIDLNAINEIFSFDVDEAQYNRMISLHEKLYGFSPNTPEIKRLGYGIINVSHDAVNILLDIGNNLNVKLKEWQSKNSDKAKLPAKVFDSLVKEVNDILESFTNDDVDDFLDDINNCL